MKGHTPKEIFQRRKSMIGSFSVHPLPSYNVLYFLILDHAEVGRDIRSVARGEGLGFGVVNQPYQVLYIVYDHYFLEGEAT
ncbi:hypothetical protein DX927_22060 [Bacillus swezeyi]|uniref:Uncharacterized protein n=1 Tax=Bacillus swezeyi TaxID=1925020 RepID=A0A5M8RK42_9BACI|nr:hypothetical protein DX927_22060 [Bacillus swezeyi]